MFRSVKGAMLLTASVSIIGTALAHSQDKQVVPNPNERQQPSTLRSPAHDPIAPIALKEVVVTGTLIEAPNFQSPTPVTSLSTSDLFMHAPGGLADALNQLPQFINSASVHLSQDVNANVQRTGNYLNLRALGSNRVLVLEDGMRLAPSGTNGSVDVDVVPQLLTKRVDVVTGGASAVYGSGAVSGVVNYVLNTHFTGLKAQVEYGDRGGGGAASNRVDIAGGVSLLGGRLHVIGSFEHYHTDMVWKKTIPLVAASIQNAGAGTAANPFVAVSNVRYDNLTYGGFVQSGPPGMQGMQFSPTGDLIPFDPGGGLAPPGKQIGGSGALLGLSCCTIIPSQTIDQAFSRAEYEFRPDLTGFASVAYTWETSSDYGLPIFRPSMTMYSDNAYLNPSVVAALGSTTSFTMGKIFGDTRGNEQTQKNKMLDVHVGLEGKIGTSWNWKATYTHSQTHWMVREIGTLNANFYAATDAVRDGSGNIVCRVTLTNPGMYPGCVPLNPFGVGQESQAAINYVRGLSMVDVINKIDSVRGTVTGTLFKGWAGPISGALGADFRRQSLNRETNTGPNSAPDLSVFRNVNHFTGLFEFVNYGGGASGSNNVKEAFGELNVPVLRNSAIGSASINAAARETDYSTSGSVTTWKIGAVLDPVPGVRLRTTYSRDIRAPSLYELFSGQQTRTLAVSDSLTGTLQYPLQISGGNPKLTPEVAKTFTGGIVLTPSWVKGLNVSADFYRINIDDAIASPFTAFQIVQICNASNQTSYLCGAVTRDASNNIISINTSLQNVASLSTSGIDFDVSYKNRVGPGIVSFEGLVTRLIKFQQQNAPGQPVSRYAGTGDMAEGNTPIPLPRWRATFNLGYKVGRFSVSGQERVIGGYNRSNVQVFKDNNVPAVPYTDLNITYNMPVYSGAMQIFGTVNNLFNTQPPIVPESNTPGLTVPTLRSTYDILGRYITVGARLEF